MGLLKVRARSVRVKGSVVDRRQGWLQAEVLCGAATAALLILSPPAFEVLSTTPFPSCGDDACIRRFASSAISLQSSARCKYFRRTVGSVVLNQVRWYSIAFLRHSRMGSVSLDDPCK